VFFLDDYFWGKSNEGIYVIYNDGIYALNEENFLNYKGKRQTGSFHR